MTQRCEKLISLMSRLCENTDYILTEDEKIPSNVEELYAWLMESGIQREKTVKKRNKKSSTSYVTSTFIELLCGTCCSRHSEAAELRKGLNRYVRVLSESVDPRSLFFIDLVLYFCHENQPSDDANEDDANEEHDADDDETKSGPMEVSEDEREEVLEEEPKKKREKLVVEEKAPRKTRRS